MGIGSEMMDFIKDWFSDDDNKTGCRFLIVDAYNKEPVLNYYKHNGFSFLFSTEEQEIEHSRMSDIGEKLRTRLMFFDLINVSSSL